MPSNSFVQRFQDYVNSSRRQRVADRNKNSLKFKIGETVKIVTHTRSDAFFVQLKGKIAKVVDIFPGIDCPYRLRFLAGGEIVPLLREEELEPYHYGATLPSVDRLDDILLQRGATIIEKSGIVVPEGASPDKVYVAPPPIGVSDNSVKEYLARTSSAVVPFSSSVSQATEPVVYAPKEKIDYLKTIAEGI